MLVTCMLTRSNEYVLTELDRVQQRGSGLIARIVVEDYFDSLTSSSMCANAQCKALDAFAEPGVARAKNMPLSAAVNVADNRTVQSAATRTVNFPAGSHTFGRSVQQYHIARARS